ncbi:MAG: flagellar hook-associated protein FlgL [bacterium]
MFSRVTNMMMTTTFINDIQRNLTKTADLQHQISTGKKVNFPSDDPIGADRILDYRQIIESTTQYIKNVDDADSQASNVDGVLSHMETMLMRVRDLAVKASNEAPNNQQMLDAMSKEIDSLINEMVFQSNQKFDGKYLFSGNKTSTTPFVAKKYIDFTYGGAAVAAGGPVTFNMPSSTINGVTRVSEAIVDTNSIKQIDLIDAAGNRTTLAPTDYTIDPVTNSITIANLPVNLASTDRIELHFDKTVSVEYKGDTGIKEIEISDGSKVGVSYAGATADASSQPTVFGKYSADGNETASVETFQKLFDLRDRIAKYSNVPGGNIQQIMEGIDDVDSIRTNITTIRAEQGGRVNRLELAKNRLNNISISTKDLKSKREDVDMAEAITQMTMAQTIYQACLASGAKIISTTLLDYLR